MLHFACSGSDHTGEIRLAPHMEGVNFGVWRMPGRGARADEPPSTSLQRLVDEITTAALGLDCRSPVLSGHSFGGLLGYLVCQELESQGRAVGRFVPVASADPSVWRRDAALAKLFGGPKKHAQRRVVMFEERGVWPPEGAESATVLQAARSRLEGDIALGLQSFRHDRINASITEVSAKDDEILKERAAQRRWAQHTSGEFESIAVTGGHFFYWRRPQVLATILKSEVELAQHN
ncbi:alpha/beta fold hydrolase [Segniliparus rotundus]|uniref:alpha/beta fold hydrolase n=1 Tax=Segniliparus rotundus TaxID=286802 RepID=UPI00059B79CB